MPNPSNWRKEQDSNLHTPFDVSPLSKRERCRSAHPSVSLAGTIAQGVLVVLSNEVTPNFTTPAKWRIRLDSNQRCLLWSPRVSSAVP